MSFDNFYNQSANCLVNGKNNEQINNFRLHFFLITNSVLTEF